MQLRVDPGNSYTIGGLGLTSTCDTGSNFDLHSGGRTFGPDVSLVFTAQANAEVTVETW